MSKRRGRPSQKMIENADESMRKKKQKKELVNLWITSAKGILGERQPTEFKSIDANQSLDNLKELKSLLNEFDEYLNIPKSRLAFKFANEDGPLAANLTLREVLERKSNSYEVPVVLFKLENLSPRASIISPKKTITLAREVVQDSTPPLSLETGASMKETVLMQKNEESGGTVPVAATLSLAGSRRKRAEEGAEVEMVEKLGVKIMKKSTPVSVPVSSSSEAARPGGTVDDEAAEQEEAREGLCNFCGNFIGKQKRYKFCSACYRLRLCFELHPEHTICCACVACQSESRTSDAIGSGGGCGAGSSADTAIAVFTPEESDTLSPEKRKELIKMQRQIITASSHAEEELLSLYGYSDSGDNGDGPGSGGDQDLFPSPERYHSDEEE